jgi:hypothetical protein
MTESEIGAIVSREITQALGFDASVLANSRTLALQYYNGQMTQPAAGRSAVVSLDVSDSIHSLLAQIGPVIQTTQIEFEARGQDDEAQSQAETDFVRIMVERNGGYTAIASACHDAFLLANGWIECSVKTDVEVNRYEYLANLSDEQLAGLLASMGPDQSATVDEKPDKTILKVKTTRRRLIVEACAPEEMLFSEDGSQYDVSQVRFVARRQLFTAAALRALGVSNEKINALPDASAEAVQTARAGIQQNQVDQLAVQDASRTKEVYRCFMRMQKGTANEVELREIWVGGTAGATVLLNRPADAVPWICGSAIPIPHRILGRSVFELLQNVQAGKTQILRAYMDNLGVMNASRVWANPDEVNMTDLTDGRINGVVRAQGPNSLGQLPATDIGPQAMAGLGYLDQVRAARVGASLDFNEVQSQIMASSATAAAGQLAKVEQMAGWFASNIVQTILKPLFLSVHRLLRTEMSGKVSAKIGGKWRETDTGQWSARDITTVSMGMTTIQKAERMQGLQTVITQLQGLIASGGNGIITDQNRLYNAMSDWIRAANLGPPDQYLIDPNSTEAKQAAAQQAKSQQQAAQAAAEAQVRMTLDSQGPLLQMQHKFKLIEQDRELSYKVWSDQLEAEVKEADMISKSMIDIKKLYKPEPKSEYQKAKTETEEIDD